MFLCREQHVEGVDELDTAAGRWITPRRIGVIGVTEQPKAPQDRVAISIGRDTEELGCCVPIPRGSHCSVRIGRFPIRGPF